MNFTEGNVSGDAVVGVHVIVENVSGGSEVFNERVSFEGDELDGELLPGSSKKLSSHGEVHIAEDLSVNESSDSISAAHSRVPLKVAEHAGQVNGVSDVVINLEIHGEVLGGDNVFGLRGGKGNGGLGSHDDASGC